ncbi:hypothetical protein P7C70_g1333, partial [Phenoliferia sp. Uapishka_3]
MAFLGMVLANIVHQLVAPRDLTKPPVVFHYVPWIGCAFSFGMDPLKFMEVNREKYGSVFTYPLFGRWITAALGPPGNDFVFNGRLAHVNAEMAYTHLTTPVFGKEVVYDVPNALFMQQKKFVKFGLTTDNFKRYVPIIVEETKDYLSKHLFSNDMNTTATIDVFLPASEITICTAAATLQGREVREAMDKSFADLFHDLDGGFTPLNFVFPNLPLPSYRRRDRARERLTDFYVEILSKRRESLDEPDNDMLTALQNQRYKDGEPLTDRQIAGIMIALLMGGQHTSAATRLDAWQIRLGYPSSWRAPFTSALYDEQLEHHGDGNGDFAPLSYETLQTPLLSAFIKEVLRVHPPVHSLMRKVISDYPVPASVASPSAEPGRTPAEKKSLEGFEYSVPKGHFVLAAPGFSMIDDRIWKDAKKFDETRWLDGKMPVAGEEDGEQEDFGWGVVSKGGKSAYLPFGAGRHRCIGEHFAHLQVATLLATLVREMTWTLPAPFPENDYTTMIVMPKSPRDVCFTRRPAHA